VLEIADRAQVDRYLETADRANVDFYKRHGFVVEPAPSSGCLTAGPVLRCDGVRGR
jgi:hypothetical protein